jgi:hypothetical protein
MPTPLEIEEQIALEREQIRQGLQQLHSNTSKLEEKDYASASVYGVASVEQLLPHVAKRSSVKLIIFFLTLNLMLQQLLLAR